MVRRVVSKPETRLQSIVPDSQGPITRGQPTVWLFIAGAYPLAIRRTEKTHLFLWHQRLHWRHTCPDHGRSRRRRCFRYRGASAVRFAATRLGRTRSPRLVARLRPGSQESAREIIFKRGGDRVRRVFWPDAWRRFAGRQRRSDSPRAHLVRSAHRKTIPRSFSTIRHAAPHSADLQSAAHEFHAHQNSLGSRE